jgi:hypothetical protein
MTRVKTRTTRTAARPELERAIADALATVARLHTASARTQPKIRARLDAQLTQLAQLAARDGRAWVTLLDRTTAGRADARRHAVTLVGALAAAGAENADARLRSLLEHRDTLLRLHAAHALLERPFAAAAPWLARALAKERDDVVRAQMIGACGALKAPRTLAALLALARADVRDLARESGVRAHLARALVAHASRRSRAYFAALFSRGRDDRERILGAHGLCALAERPPDHEEAHAFLLARLADRDVNHAYGALWALKDLYGLAYPATPSGLRLCRSAFLG